MKSNNDFYNKMKARRVSPKKHQTFKLLLNRLFPFVSHMPSRVRLLQVMSTLHVEEKLNKKGSSLHKLVKLISAAYQLNEKRVKRF